MKPYRIIDIIQDFDDYGPMLSKIPVFKLQDEQYDYLVLKASPWDIGIDDNDLARAMNINNVTFLFDYTLMGHWFKYGYTNYERFKISKVNIVNEDQISDRIKEISRRYQCSTKR